MRAERSDAGRAAGRGYPSPRAGGSAPAGRKVERSGRARSERQRAEDERPPRGGHPADGRGLDPREPVRPSARPSGEVRRPASQADSRRTGAPATARSAAPGVRGGLAVLGVFLLTLAAAGADSYLGPGLGTITLVALTAGTLAAALVVRRRDLLSVVVAPPLVFVAVAVLNIVLAPSASLSLPALATLLVRGFPAMGIATAAAVLASLFRLVARR